MSNLPGTGIPVKGVYLYGVVAVSACFGLELSVDQSIKEAFTAHQSLCRMMIVLFPALSACR